MTSSVQSLNPVVLKTIKRDNISLDTYAEVQKDLHAQGMQSYGELILCMPGETKASFMDAVDKLIETGVSRVAAHQLMLLHGAPLANPDSRAEFGFKTRHRIVARCLGDYGDGIVVETEEMVVESEAFSFQDYLDENRAELFATREDCVNWAKAHYDGLISGELGGNLLSKYAMIGRFIAVAQALDFLQRAIGDLIPREDREARVMLDCITAYDRSVMPHVPFAETLEQAPHWKTCYDIEAWRAADFARPLADFRMAEPIEIPTRVSPSVKEVLTARIAAFGEHPSGLGRLTRTMFANDFHRQLDRDAARVAAE